MDKSKFPKKHREFEEVEGGEYDSYGFYYTPENSFWDDEGYYFNREGFDIYGGYYDDNNQYVPGKGWNKKLGKYNYQPNDDDDFIYDEGFAADLEGDLYEEEVEPYENYDNFVVHHQSQNDEDYNRFVSQMKSNKKDDFLFDKEEEDFSEPHIKKSSHIKYEDTQNKSITSKPVNTLNENKQVKNNSDNTTPKTQPFNYYATYYSNADNLLSDTAGNYNSYKNNKNKEYSNNYNRNTNNNQYRGKGRKNYNDYDYDYYY